MKMVKYELAVVHKKDLILTMEEDVDSEEVLKIFLETLKENEKNQGESLKPLKLEGEKENVTVYWWFCDWRHIWCCTNVPVTD